MSISMSEGILSLVFSEMGTVTLAVLVLLLGNYIKSRIYFFEKYCIPAPVIGGIIFSVLNLIFHQSNLVSITLTKTYQDDFMFMFFTIVGFGASIALLKEGGPKLIKYFVLTGVLISLQGIFGILSASLAGVDQMLGIIAGPASLAGGHGSVAAYGQMLEDIGHTGVMVTGMAAATFGLIGGSIFGGPLCERLVQKHNLKSTSKDGLENDVTTIDTTKNKKKKVTIRHNVDTGEVLLNELFKHIAIIGLFMTLGNYLGTILGNLLSISLPGFVGPMLIAFTVRNLNEKYEWFQVNQVLLDKMSDLSLGIFLAMAMISLNLWELFDLAIPLLIILTLELILTLLFIYYIAFRILGKDFDSAVMCAGLTGHALGATPTGMANMESVSSKYGVSRLAFLIVPIVGGFLQDMFLVPINVLLINLFG